MRKGAPRRVRGLSSPPGWVRTGGGVSARWCAGFRGGRVGAVWESVVARGARPWAGEGREGSGGTGETRALGGFPGSPGALQFPGPAGAARYQRACAVHFPRSLARCVAFVWGGRNGGLGENLEPGRGFRGRGGSGFSPSAFPDWSPLLHVYSRSRAVVFPTSPSCSMRG